MILKLPDLIFKHKDKFNISQVTSKEWISLIDWNKITVEKLQNNQYEYYDNNVDGTNWNFKFAISKEEPTNKLSRVDANDPQATIDNNKKVYSEIINVSVSSFVENITTTATELNLEKTLDEYTNYWSK